MLHTPEAALDRVLETLSALHPKKIDLSLGRMKRLLKALGNPEKKLPPVIHVAGTNGKGSVIAYLRGIFEAAGLKPHVYTSPHLVSFRERICLKGRLIGEDHLIDILTRTEAANRSNPITFFEVTTAAAFLAFSQTPGDVLILEVGLGGRLDATNVVTPLLSVITPVGLDHAEFLGTGLSGVAAEKAGIIKPGVPVVVSPQGPKVLKILKARAGDLGAPFTVAGRKAALPPLPLSGPHQKQNARTAVAAIKAQTKFKIPECAITTGLEEARWPARLQRLDPRAFKAGFGAETEILLDGGHNSMAGRALAKTLEQDRGRPVYAVVGMMANKDTRGFLRPMAPSLQGVFAVDIPGQENGAPAQTIAGAAASLGIAAKTAGSVDAALDQIPQNPPPKILIAGSLYLAGSVLAGIGWQPE